MKKILILGVLLTGLALVEYGCIDRRSGENYREGRITGISGTFLFEVDPFGTISTLVQDSTPWDSFVMLNVFDVTYASSLKTNYFAAFAEPALPPSLVLSLDSVQVWNVANEDTINITHLFELQIGRNTNYYFPISNDYNFLQELNYEVFGSNYEHLFRMKASPSAEGSFRFYVKYFVTDGLELESLSDVITVTL